MRTHQIPFAMMISVTRTFRQFRGALPCASKNHVQNNKIARQKLVNAKPLMKSFAEEDAMLTMIAISGQGN